MNTPTYNLNSDKTQLIAMIHVGSTVALQNTDYNNLLNVETYSVNDLRTLQEIRNNLYSLHREILRENNTPYLLECKSSVFILKQTETRKLAEQLIQLNFVQKLVDRALHEADVFTRNGIKMLAIENFGAPYAMGSGVPFEELLIMHIVTSAVREKYPDIPLGMHVLSSDELESLPIAITSNVCFIRSEASIYQGFRPEGKTSNNGTLSKLFYLRNYFQSILGVENPVERRFPKVWSDLQKKHTIFNEQLHDLSTWLHNMMFMKLEGIIVTGSETGSDVSEKDLVRAREGITQLEEQTRKYFGKGLRIPLITGSGMDMGLYKKYADFIITGTQLKRNQYWENEVDEDNVKKLVETF